MLSQNKTKYKDWQQIVKGTVNDILEYHRLENDLVELEKSASTLESTLRNNKNEVEEVKTLIESIEGEVKDFRELSDASKIWIEASLRISLQRGQVNQKEADFRLMNSDREGRDLNQVEADLLESNREKDNYNGTFFSNFVFSIKWLLKNPNIQCLFDCIHISMKW